MRACCHCRTHDPENHRDDKAPGNKIRHVFIVIYCPWISSTTFKSFWVVIAAGRSTVPCRWESPNINGLVRKLIGIKRSLMRQCSELTAFCSYQMTNHQEAV